MAGDTYLTTNTTNFSDTVVATVLKQVQVTLRGGLAFTPPGSIIPAVFSPGTGQSGTFIAAEYGDVPEGGAVILETGDSDPVVESMAVNVVTFDAHPYGRTVGVEKTAQERSPHNLIGIAAEKIAHDILVSVDNIPRTLYAAQAPVLFGGASKSSIGSLAVGDKMTAGLLKDAVALLRATNVAPLTVNGRYSFVASPLMIRDLQEDTTYREEMQFADPKTFLTGQVGVYAGCSIIDPGSRAIVKGGAGSGSVDVYYGCLIGQAACFAALAGLKVIPVIAPDHSDPLGRRSLFSWRGWLGGVLNTIQTERFINIACVPSLA